MSAIRLILLMAATAGLPMAAAEKWHRIATPNFDVLTSAGVGRGKAAAQHFERVRSFFFQTSKIVPPSGRPVRVIAFSSAKQYEPYKISEVAAAYYISGYDGDTIVMKGLDTEMFQTAIHEYVHVLIRHTKSKYPLWLNEGTAEFFSTMKPVGGKVRIGEYPLGNYLTARTRKLLPLYELFAVDPTSPHYNEKDRAGVFYSQSWAMVHMLNLSEGYRDDYPQFLKILLSGETAAAAIRQVYGAELEQVQRDLEGYLRQDTYFVGHIDVKLEKAAEVPQVREAPEVEVGLALAGLLANGRKPEAAQAEYQRIALMNPQMPEPWEAMAYLEMRGRNRAEAAKHFAKAAELGSTSAQMYFDWSWALEGEENAVSAIPSRLRKNA